jgi:hypothetical protein
MGSSGLRYVVLADGVVVGRNLQDALGCGPSLLAIMEDRTPTHGYAATREAAMAAFARSWRRE